MAQVFSPDFIEVSHMSDAQVKRMGHHDEYYVQGEAPAANPMAAELRAAASRFELRGQTRNADTCRDLASKLERFGSFVSDKQAGYAAQLLSWSKPAAPVAAPARPVAAPQPVALALPRLSALMQRLHALQIGELKLTRERDGTKVWIKHAKAERVVGLIDGLSVKLFERPGVASATVQAELLLIEADPEGAAVLHGKATSRCAVCSRELTDPASRARGIGPICAESF